MIRAEHFRKRVAFVIGMVLLLGFAFRIMHWPYGLNIVILGVFLYGVNQFPLFAIGKKFSGEEKTLFWLAFGAGFVSAIAILGFLFYIMKWPYTWIILASSWIPCLAVSIQLFYFSKKAETPQFKSLAKHWALRPALYGMLAFGLVLFRFLG
ncbi:hypothetical protein [Luteibaculum oceani]|uniref:Uncharacterized protein n=1 Tax=Luteibaculum oceani TaxID=1294296 RepID=A0A5C6UZI6_9FLAO|nr:hypothetical protein [Luteibaculum oceani]TXC76055.1 hypothetical protein FRX97_11110 [Luteibaculum oceani]